MTGHELRQRAQALEQAAARTDYPGAGLALEQGAADARAEAERLDREGSDDE